MPSEAAVAGPLLLPHPRDDGEEIALTDAGAYWLHVVQDLFSIDGVGKLWSTAMSEPWPEAAAL